MTSEPMQMPALTPGLTVTMICRNERENLEALLPTIVGAVDQVIVVDTGSSDGTAEAAAAHGARVVFTPWTNDFAAARNFGLAEVRTSHTIWLDADDRIEAEDLRRVRETCLARGREGLMLLLVNEDPDPAAVTSCLQLRAFPTDATHRFEGRIHEQIFPALKRSGTPTSTLDVTVRHVGYADPVVVAKKSQRNYDFLREEFDAGDRSVNTVYHFVKAAAKLGHWEEVASIAREALESPRAALSPDVQQYMRVELAIAETRLGRVSEALRLLREAVNSHPQDAFALFFLGTHLRRDGQLGEALRAFQAARNGGFHFPQLPLPVAGLTRAIRLQLGELLEVFGQPLEAHLVMTELLATHPEDVAAKRAMARVELALGNADAARIHLDDISGKLSSDPELAFLRATCAFLSGADGSAESGFIELETLDPHGWAAPLHRGHLALRQKKHDQALSHYARALAKADRPETRVGLAACQFEIGMVRESLEHLARAVELGQGQPLPWGTEALCGEILFQAGRPEEARDALEKHLRRGGTEARIISRLADCYRVMKQHKAAEVGYAEALRLDPTHEGAREGLRAIQAVSSPTS